MDLIKQNKFIGWVIAILVTLNLATLAIIWLQSSHRFAAPGAESNIPPDNSVKLIQKEIGLSGEQTQQYQVMRKDFQEKTKDINDELNSLKLRIADEIFKSTPNKNSVDSMAGRIGALQARIEVIRFDHFRSLVQICDSGQKSKLQPVLSEVFGKKKQPEDPAQKPPRMKENKGENETKNDHELRVPAPGDRQGPPSIDEKVDKYSKRLSLSQAQIKEVSSILKISHEKSAKLRDRENPGPGEIEAEKSKIRKTEDESIMKILSPDQKAEFEKMIQKRNR